MYGDPELWHALLRPAGRRSPPPSCGCRSRPGASAVQLFDSWVGALPAADYARVRAAALGARSSPRSASSACRASTSASAPASCSALMGEAGADVVGVDFRVPLDEAARRVGPDRALQGNLDPAVLFAPWEVVAERTRAGRWPPGAPRRATSSTSATASCPTTDPDVLTRVVELVHAESSAGSRRRPGPAGRRRCGGGSATPAAAGTPTRAPTTANGSSAPSTVRTTSVMPTNASQPAAQPGQEAEVLVVLRRRHGAVRRDQGDLDGGQVGHVPQLGSWACSDSRSASRRASSASTCTTSPIVSARDSSTRTRSTLRCCERTRLSTSVTWVVTSSALRCRSSSLPSRPSASQGRAERRRRHPQGERGLAEPPGAAGRWRSAPRTRPRRRRWPAPRRGRAAGPRR